MKHAAWILCLALGCKADKPSASKSVEPAATPTERAQTDDHKGWGSNMTPEEREQKRHERVQHMRERLDTNGDGKLTPDELAASTGRMHFEDPAKLDTNHDGDISVDELEAGIKERRDQMWRGNLTGPAAAAAGSSAP